MSGKPGWKQTESAKRRIAEAKRGERNPNWRGAAAGYSAVHVWLNDNYPRTGRCERCGEERKTEWAFLRYPKLTTRNRDDYAEMCRRCHVRYDFSTGQRIGHK